MKTRCSISFSIQLLFLFSLFDFVDVTRIFGLFFFLLVVVMVMVVLHYSISLKCVSVCFVCVRVSKCLCVSARVLRT